MNRRGFLAVFAGGLAAVALATRLGETKLAVAETIGPKAGTNPLLSGTMSTCEGLTIHQIKRVREALDAAAIEPADGHYVVFVSPDSWVDAMRSSFPGVRVIPQSELCLAS